MYDFIQQSNEQLAHLAMYTGFLIYLTYELRGAFTALNRWRKRRQARSVGWPV